MPPYARHIDIQGVCQDKEQPELRRSHAPICQPELPLQDGINIGINGQTQIPGKDEQRHVHVEEGGKPGSQEYHAGGDGIQRMVNEEAVNRSLRVPRSCQRAVQTVAIPMDDQPKRGKPQETDIPVGKPASKHIECGAGNTDVGQDVRSHPLWLSLCQPY